MRRAIVRECDSRQDQGVDAEAGEAESEMKAGKSAEAAAAEYTVPEPYASKGYTKTVAPYFGGMKTLIQGIYDELQKK
jgi:hypothetical protein